MMAGSIILQLVREVCLLGGLAGKMPYTAGIAMIGALTIIGIPPTVDLCLNGFYLQVYYKQQLRVRSLRVILFGFGILTTVLSSAYILWMYKRIFFGKIPEGWLHHRSK